MYHPRLKGSHYEIWKHYGELLYKTGEDLSSVIKLNKEKKLFAFFLSPSPRVFATTADPPVPKIKPMVESIIKKGIIKFSAANGVFPAKLETKNPSTIEYTDVKIIIIIEGRVNLRSRP